MPSWALFLLTTLLLKYRYHHTPKRFESLLGRRRGDVQACSVEYEKSRQEGSSINWRTTVKLTWIIIIQERNHLSQRCFVDATKRMRRFGYLPVWRLNFLPSSPLQSDIVKKPNPASLRISAYVPNLMLCADAIRRCFWSNETNRPWLLEFDATTHWRTQIT